MNVDYFKNVSQYLFTLKDEDKVEEKCIHSLVEVNGFNTCKLCGIVVNQIFKTETEDFKFYEDKQRKKSQHNQLHYIKSHFVNYINNANSKKLTKKQLLSLEIYLFKHANSCFKDEIQFVWIKKWVKQNKLCFIHFPEIYCYLFSKESQSKKINISMSEKILNLYKQFIKFYKDKVKNISKRILFYYIAKHIYDIELEDYIYGTTENTKIKYKKLTDDFFHAYII